MMDAYIYMGKCHDSSHRAPTDTAVIVCCFVKQLGSELELEDYRLGSPAH